MRALQQERHIRWVARIASLGVLASLMVWADSAAAIERPEAPPSHSSDVDDDRVNDQTTIKEDGIPEQDRADLLGEDSREVDVDDVAYSTIGGPDGVAVLRGRASSGYAWERVAELPTPDIDTDLWVSNSCMDPSSRFMAVVYAPRSFSNREELFQRGAWGAVVDLEAENVVSLGRGVCPELG